MGDLPDQLWRGRVARPCFLGGASCLRWLRALVVFRRAGRLGGVCPAVETMVMGLAMLRAMWVCGRGGERPSLVVVPR